MQLKFIIYKNGIQETAAIQDFSHFENAALHAVSAGDPIIVPIGVVPKTNPAALKHAAVVAAHPE